MLFNVAIVLLSVFLVVFFVFSQDGILDFIRYHRRNHVELFARWIVFAVFLNLFNIFLDGVILYLFTKNACPEIKFRQAIHVGLTGQFYCAVTPGASGGQPMQILAFSRMGIDAGGGTSALVQKFLVWQFVLCSYSIVAVAKARLHVLPLSAVPVIIGFAAQIGMIVLLLMASLNQKLTTKVAFFFCDLGAKIHLLHNVEQKKESVNRLLTSFHDNNRRLTGHVPLLVKTFFLTFLQMTAYFMVPYSIARAFGAHYNLFDMLCAQALVSMVSGLVPLPGASGVTEYCFSVFFTAYFTPWMMKSAILIWRTIVYYGTIAITAPFAGLSKRKRSNNVEKGTDVPKPEQDHSEENV